MQNLKILPKPSVRPLIAVAAFLALFGSPAVASSSATHAPVTVNGKILEMKVWHKMVLPGETLTIDINSNHYAAIDGVPISRSWTAPSEAGSHELKVFDGYSQEVQHVTIFVMEPSSSISPKGYIGKYRIGKYPRNTPRGFIKLEKSDRDLPISPHFKIGQFLCKQQPGTWPKYLIVSEDNLVRLETLLSFIQRTHDNDAETLFVMSGYRTPFYNSAIGSARFSRHMYGDAADVYVDTKPRDGNMDDINGDGRITKADANYMYDQAQKLFAKDGLKQGGLGAYRANAVHGPFVHVDARGYRARWGR